MATNTAFGRLTMGLTMTAMLLGVGMVAPAASALGEGLADVPLDGVVGVACSVLSTHELEPIAHPIGGCAVLGPCAGLSGGAYLVCMCRLWGGPFGGVGHLCESLHDI